jgi:hypothetical protein
MPNFTERKSVTLNKLASLIAKREGKRSQARIGDIREILKIISVLEAEYVVSSWADDGPLRVIGKSAEKKADKLRSEFMRKAKRDAK